MGDLITEPPSHGHVPKCSRFLVFLVCSMDILFYLLPNFPHSIDILCITMVLLNQRSTWRCIQKTAPYFTQRTQRYDTVRKFHLFSPRPNDLTRAPYSFADSVQFAFCSFTTLDLNRK